MLLFLLEYFMTATNLFKKYETDHAKEVTGVPIDIEGVTFICRRAGGGNRSYRTALGILSLSPEFKDRLRNPDQDIAMAAEDDVTMQAFADGVVVGWQDVLDRNDEPLPFSKENFLDLMRSCPDVWMVLRMKAHEVDNFRLEAVKEVGEAVGN